MVDGGKEEEKEEGWGCVRLFTAHFAGDGVFIDGVVFFLLFLFVMCFYSGGLMCPQWL